MTRTCATRDWLDAICSLSEASDVDAMIEGVAREEEEGLHRQHGQAILDMLEARNTQDVDPLLEALNQAHQAKASEVEADNQ
jgi:hypothetical protein